MKKIKTGWNDTTGAKAICNLTVMIENMGIIDDGIESHTFSALVDFWDLTFKHNEEEE